MLIHLIQPVGQIIVAFGVGNIVLDGAVQRVTVHGVIHSAALAGFHFLTHMGNPPFGRNIQITAIDVQFAVQ